MFEIIIGIINGALALAVFRLYFARDDKDRGGFFENNKLKDRVEKLEVETRYVADQPQRYYSIGSYLDTEEWEKKQRENDVPLADVVKAIVKHLNMEILKSPETINKTPMEVKLVEKPKVVMSSTGVVTMPDGSGIPMSSTKPKRKYTKRKQGVKK